jgi:hypothetical protein
MQTVWPTRTAAGHSWRRMTPPKTLLWRYSQSISSQMDSVDHTKKALVLLLRPAVCATLDLASQRLSLVCRPGSEEALIFKDTKCVAIKPRATLATIEFTQRRSALV